MDWYQTTSNTRLESWTNIQASPLIDANQNHCTTENHTHYFNGHFLDEPVSDASLLYDFPFVFVPILCTLSGQVKTSYYIRHNTTKYTSHVQQDMTAWIMAYNRKSNEKSVQKEAKHLRHILSMAVSSHDLQIPQYKWFGEVEKTRKI